MKNATCLLLTLALFFSLPIKAQDYSRVDAYVEKLGPLSNLNVATIADTLTESFPSKADKARAIFYWITHNIALDLKASRAGDQKRSDPVQVVLHRKATPVGYSLLVQEMCSMATIRCLSVDGYVKNFPEDINNKADEFNHSWNVVQLGQSPEEWYYVDAAKASGFPDKKYSLFTKQFTTEYFFADKTLFNLDHFPDNPAWQLGKTGGPKTLKDFYALPVISLAAYEYGLTKVAPATGSIKTKTKNAVSFSFPYNGKTVESVTLLMGEGRSAAKPEPMNFTASGGAISFTYQFKKEDSFPLRIMVDGKELVAYMMEVEE